MSNGNKTGWIIGGVAIAAIAVGAIILTDFDIEDGGSLPSVSVEGGELPETDLDVADVDVGTTTEEVEVTMPTMDVDLPGEGDEDDVNNIDGIDGELDVDVDADVDADLDPDVNIPD